MKLIKIFPAIRLPFVAAELSIRSVFIERHPFTNRGYSDEPFDSDVLHSIASGALP